MNVCLFLTISASVYLCFPASLSLSRLLYLCLYLSLALCYQQKQRNNYNRCRPILSVFLTCNVTVCHRTSAGEPAASAIPPSEPAPAAPAASVPAPPTPSKPVPLPARLKIADVAHSLPTDVPLVTGLDNVPRTPRTPGGHVDTKRGPRFYPVVKDRAPRRDPQVSRRPLTSDLPTLRLRSPTPHLRPLVSDLTTPCCRPLYL